MHSVAIFRSTPPRMAGVVGAIYNSALQLGSAVGISAVTSISTNIQKKAGPDGFSDFKGRAAAFWFVLAVVGTSIISVLVFYKPERTVSESNNVADVEKAQGSNSTSELRSGAAQLRTA